LQLHVGAQAPPAGHVLGAQVPGEQVPELQEPDMHGLVQVPEAQLGGGAAGIAADGR
jgi:hypothetical protein